VRHRESSKFLDALPVARQIYGNECVSYRCAGGSSSFPGGLDGNCRDLLALTDICVVLCEQRIIREGARYLATLEEEPDEAEETALSMGFTSLSPYAFEGVHHIVLSLHV